MKKAFYIVIILILTSCAFKNESPPTSDTGTTNSQSQESEVAITKEIIVQFSEIELKRKVQGYGTDFYSLNSPITLPANVPDEVLLDVSQIIATGRIQAEAIANQKITPLSSNWQREGILKLSGLRLVLPDSDPASTVVTLVATDPKTGKKIFELRMELKTPPKISQFETVGRYGVSGIPKYLRSPNRAMYLLAALKFKNTTTDRIEINSKIYLKGVLTRDFQNFFIQPLDECETRLHTRTWTDEYPTDVYILPGDDNLDKTWTLKLSDPGNRARIFINPNEIRLLAVYGSGEQLNEFMNTGVPQISPNIERHSCSCTDHYEPGDGDCCHGRSCRDLIMITGCGGRHWKSQNPCDLKSGNQASNIINLNIDPNTLDGRARSGISSEIDDPATRPAQLIKNQIQVF